MYRLLVNVLKEPYLAIVRQHSTRAQFGGCKSQQTTFSVSRCRRTQLRRATQWNACRHMASFGAKKQENVMNIFDRRAKRMQKNRTALLDNYEVFDYLKEEVGFRVADRVCDIKRQFGVAVDLGCGRGHVSKHLYKDMVDQLYQYEFAENLLEQSAVSPEVATTKVHCDEEALSFQENSLDLVVSSLSLHWVNDLPGAFKQVNHALKRDAPFIGAMFGGETLYELRVALQLAEMEREGGFAPHISPFTSIQDLGNLLSRAGYTLLTIDVDEMVIHYPSMFEVMHDLKGMGENNCSWSRRPMLHRDSMMAAAAIYQEMYGTEGQEGVPATFQVIYFIGWKADPSQPKPAKRGSGQVSLKDIDKLDKLAKEVEGMKSDTQQFHKPLDKLSEDIEKLRLKTMEDTDGERGDKK